MPLKPDQYMIVGLDHCSSDARVLFMRLLEGEPLDLVREPTNKFDPNAIQVIARGQRIGYIRKQQALALAERIDETGIAMDEGGPRQAAATLWFTENSRQPVAMLVEHAGEAS